MAGVIHPQFHSSEKHLDHDDGTVSPPSETSEDTTSSEEVHSPKMRDNDEHEGEEKQSAAAEGNQAENVLVIDTTFTCKIVAPGMDPFEVKVSSEEIVQEIRNMLMDTEEQCHRTCFALNLDGNTLDAYTELKNIPGMKEGAEIRVLEDFYTVREARFHVKRIKEILTSCELTDSYTGTNMCSLSFVNGIWSGDGNIGRKAKAGEGSVDCTPPEYIMPKSKERPLLPLHPNLAENKVPTCVKILSYDHWNPPPSYRKLHGDLLYLQITTLEDKKYHATACTKGFYINQSSEEEFNPKPSPNFKACHHSLVDLLSMVSPGFKRTWSSVVKKRYSKHIYERMPTPYQVYSWLAPQPEHTIDLVRMEDGLMTGRLGYEDNLPSGSRDWNEEFQIVKELAKKTLPERVDRERSHFKVNSDFVWAATRGAQLVVDGCLMPINPGEETKMQMFIWNNIFFSMGFDVKDHYKDFGGDYAAHVAPAKDLQGVKSYQELDIDGLCTLGTVVVDYRGYRVTAQSIIPGILEKEQEQSVVQGSIDFGKTVVADSRYKALLEKAGQSLRTRSHKIINHEGETIELYSSVDCKGIVGNDGRLYILDLLRTFPVDINYTKSQDNEEVVLSDELKKAGYPLDSRHSFVTLRQELIDAFVDMRYMGFVRTAALLLEQQRQNKEAAESTKSHKEDDKPAESDKDEEKIPVPEALPNGESTSPLPAAADEDAENAKKMVETLLETKEAKLAAAEEADLTETVLRKAAKAVGSLCEKEFNISFNPDLYQPKVTHAEPDSEALKTDKAMLNKITEFLVFHQIPAFIQTCSDHTLSPVDGQTLTESLHTRGINVRYLGRIANLIQDIPTLSYLYAICVSEMLCRSAKHLFQRYMHCTDTTNIAAGVAHFLNCLLSSCSLPTSSPYSGDSLSPTQPKSTKKKNKKGKNKRAKENALERSEWGALVPKSLWTKLNTNIKQHFNFSLESDSIDTACEKYKFQKISLLRSFSQRVGIQILLREYNFDNRQRQPFYEDDIIDMYPIVKHVAPKATDAYRFFTSGQAKIQQGMFKEGYNLILESLNLLSVYGPMHSEIAACCRLLGRLNYLMGDFAEALSYQQKAAIMNERCLGIDHPSTITDYVHLAIYSFANNQISSALQVLYRSRYLLLLTFGENHPDVALVDINIGLILNGVGEYELACNFISNAKDLFTTFYGAASLKVATAFHLLARSYSCRGDFRTALSYEKSAYVVYNQRLGEAHEKTRESSECLKHLTHQAVVFQKKMVELGKGDKGVGLPAIQAILQSIQVPSVRSILDTLNVVNGIAVPVPFCTSPAPKNVPAVTSEQVDVSDVAATVEPAPTIEFPASKVVIADDLD